MPRLPPYLQSILEEHFEEVQMLWELRQAAMTDPDFVRPEVKEIEERIEAHVDALLLAGESARPMLVEALAEGESPVTFAAAFVLLRSGEPESAKLVASAFLAAQGEGLEGLKAAYFHGGIASAAGMLQSALDHDNPQVAMAAAEALAYHGQLDSSDRRVTGRLRHDDPLVRRSAWRAIAFAGE